jgi:L-ascorbate metabolism protein UlaG (beta-lactamase superfamily)
VLKRRQIALKLAAQLGKGRGQMRLFDSVNPPAGVKVRPDLSRWEDRELSAAWIGHATILLRFGGMTILTDPVFGSRVGLGLGLATLGPKRFIAPALSLKQLPKVDLILSSHAHFDHLDRPSLAALDKKTPVVMADQTKDLVWDLGFRNVTELRWGETKHFNGLAVTARKVRHWGARTFLDSHRGYNSYLLQSRAKKVLYGGDTAYQDYFDDIGGVDLAILGIGAYDPYIHAHASPEEVWKMAEAMRADHVLPMHHSTFKLSHEPMNEPIERIVNAAGKEEGRIVVKEVGRVWEFGK